MSKKHAVAEQVGDDSATETTLILRNDNPGLQDADDNLNNCHDEVCDDVETPEECSDAPTLLKEKCCVCKSTVNVRRCGKCKLTSYCSKACQLEHLSHHAPYCSMIADLTKIEIKKLYKNFSVRQVQVDFKTKRKMVKLVGEKPMLSCFLGGKSSKYYGTPDQWLV